jgi:hypothetical protein
MVLIGDVDNVEGLASILGSRVAFSPMKYLGFFWRHRISLHLFGMKLLKKIERRLAGWKRLCLSKGGRLTLIKSTLFNLPNYLSISPIPVGVAKMIEKLHIDFLWGGIGDEFKFHFVNGLKICSLMLTGGLGVSNLIHFN